MVFALLVPAVFSLFAAPFPIFTPDDAELSPYDNLKLGVPSFDEVIVLDREGFAVGYSPHDQVPLWVCYQLTAGEVRNKMILRASRFHPDPAIALSGRPEDYCGTGYDRGHIVPAADLGFSVETMRDGFLMSNIAPQLPGLNRGSWRALEEAIRQCAIREQKLAVAGGVFFEPGKSITRIGGGVAVPHGFYKVVLDLTPPMKAIGFLFFHEESSWSFTSFACSVDEVELRTGLNFFNRLPAELEKELECTFSVEAWGFATPGGVTPGMAAESGQ